jgi:hypothetical protein
MAESQHIAYISDVGAAELKPLFVAGCVLTTVLLDLSFGFDRWLRHRGRLAPNTTTGEKVLSGLTIVFAVVGTVGLILLSVFDTARYPRQHNIFLLLFIAGYVLSAIFICWEYQRLGKRKPSFLLSSVPSPQTPLTNRHRPGYREHRVLRLSFYIKLAFVVVEILLAVAFVACTFTKHYNPGAVLEWVIAFIFSFYVFSFYIDLYPAAATKQQLAVSGNGRGGLKMRLAPGGGGGEKQTPIRGRYDASGEMEEATGSDETVGAPRAAHGRRSGVMPSNF